MEKTQDCLEMKCHQKIIREQKAWENGIDGLFGAYWKDLDTDIKRAELREVSLRTASVIIEEYEYLGVMSGAAKRPDYFLNGKRITGHVGKISDDMTISPRTRKGRYVFILGNKKERREIRNKLLWNVSDYPKRAAEVSEVTS